jgi:hypothetical protein
METVSLEYMHKKYRVANNPTKLVLLVLMEIEKFVLIEKT